MGFKLIKFRTKVSLVILEHTLVCLKKKSKEFRINHLQTLFFPKNWNAQDKSQLIYA